MNHKLTLSAAGIAAGLAATLIATPIMAQRERGGGQNRPSRQCMQEVMQLCGQSGRPDRSKIRACLQEKSDELSDECASELQQRRQQREGQREPTRAYQRAVKPTRTVFYGSDPRQQIDVYEPEGAVDDLPLVLFIHGGGWRAGDNKYVQQKPAHFNANNLYFASTGYRLLPAAPVEQQAADVGAAVQSLVGQAGSIGFDTKRIVLMGHSSGAHLAALVGSDPKYAGEAFDAIRGVVLLDGAGYDVPATIADAKTEGRTRAMNLYREVFSDDPERQKALSALSHVGGPDAPHWLALYVDGRKATQTQSQSLVNALAETGASAGALPIADTDHSRLTREIGTDSGAAQTQAIDAFLAEVFG